MLKIEDLTVRYNTRPDPAVSSVSLSVGKGESVLITGDSASGKSTLMQAVCGFIPSIVPAKVSGRILIDGKELKDPIEIARKVCMVQQDPETQFCTDLVWEEVAFGPENFCYSKDAVAKVVDESLGAVGATELRDRKLSTLSGGEKQKVAIASVLALEPELIVLDEPTSSLDPRSVNEAVLAIRALGERHTITTIVVEHRINEFLSMADRIVKMKNGRIDSDVARGDPEFERIKSEATAAPEYPSVSVREQFALSIERLSFRIAGKEILKDVSFKVKDGAIVALMGENGAGKTTLLRHIIGLVKPDAGRVEVFGRVNGDGANIEPWSLAEDVGFVFQNPNHQIFGETVEREIEFASENFRKPTELAHSAAQRFATEEGIELESHPNCLSLGQKRRLNIISSSVHGPRLLLLDEPFVGQDRSNALKITELLARLQREGKTVIIVTHDMDLARGFCTDVVLLSRGRNVSAESPKETLARAAKALEAR